MQPLTRPARSTTMKHGPYTRRKKMEVQEWQIMRGRKLGRRKLGEVPLHVLNEPAVSPPSTLEKRHQRRMGRKSKETVVMRR